MSRSDSEKVLSGLRIAAGLVIGIILMGLLLWGTGVIFSKLDGSKPLAWAATGLALVTMGATAHRWAWVMSGWLAISVLNGILMTATGHLLNKPSVIISRPEMTIMTVLVAVGCVLSLHLYAKPPRGIEKALLAGYPVCFVGAVWLHGIASLSAGTGLLFLLWFNRRRAQEVRARFLSERLR